MDGEGDNKPKPDPIGEAAAAAAVASAPTPPAGPMREDQVQNAVRFLSHPKVRGSPVLYRRSFLEKKGLSKEEIDEAFGRVPDSSPSTGTGADPPLSTSQQPNASMAVAAPVAQPMAVMAPAVVNRTYNWYHIVLATGILAAGTTGTVVFFKRVLVPRIKSWIKKVIAEKEVEAEKEEKQSSKVAEEAAEAAKAAASAAALVAKASQELLSSRNEEKGYFEAFMRALDVQVKEMKLMGEAIKKLEKKENGVTEDQYHYPATRNGPVSNVWGAQPVSTNGTFASDYARPSSAPGLTEPVNYKSYKEMMTMGPQKTERAPTSKPWETAPALPNQRPTYTYAQSYSSDDGSNPEARESAYNATSSYPLNGTMTSTATDTSSEQWWLKKSPESDEPKQFASGSAGYDAGSSQTQVPQRRWVPPQPPPVVMAEAAAAIRQPKSKSNPIIDEGADGTTIKAKGASDKADDVVVKAVDVTPSGKFGVSEAAVGPSNGVEIVQEGKVDAVEANDV